MLTERLKDISKVRSLRAAVLRMRLLTWPRDRPHELKNPCEREVDGDDAPTRMFPDPFPGQQRPVACWRVVEDERRRDLWVLEVLVGVDGRRGREGDEETYEDECPVEVLAGPPAERVHPDPARRSDWS